MTRRNIFRFLLRRKEATWRHVLFTGQAQLAATVDQLRASSCKRDDVQTLLAGAAAIPGGIPQDKLAAALNDRVTLGSLALATRLALSELYLNDMGGFFLLDDPFTDMDASRRAAAIHALASFSEKHQVLFFTCHPEHARELENVPNATTLQWTE